jgi:predicted nucleotidyltransferase
MIDVPRQYQEEILRILKKYFAHEKVVFYGSRVKGTSKLYSDLDVGVLGEEKIPLNRLSLAEEEFSESDIPFRVEIQDMNRCTESFRQRIEREGVEVFSIQGSFFSNSPSYSEGKGSQ